jgi:superfamily II DNA or RNA helicase
MTSKLIGEEVMDIIDSAEKKTILFSSYIDSLEQAETACKKYGFTPMVITGEHSSQVKQLLDTFKSSPKINPLIASIKVLSTGHTITEANTVIFLNVPFRSVDYQQASDRVYRIGQDVDVYIYKLLLDTGDEPNLSTRMHDILTWSKEQFGAIIEGEIEDDTVSKIVSQLCLGGDGIFDIAKRLVDVVPRLFK